MFDFNAIAEIRLDAITTKEGKYVVDTCNTMDVGWETAIWTYDNIIVIVEEYKNKEEAYEKHKFWVEFVKTKPRKVHSVQFNEDIDLFVSDPVDDFIENSEEHIYNKYCERFPEVITSDFILENDNLYDFAKDLLEEEN